MALAACQSGPGPSAGEINGDTEADGIFGGQIVRENSALAQRVVGLRFQNTQHEWQSCTGAWIANDWILTAAHCVSENLADNHVYQSSSLEDIDDQEIGDSLRVTQVVVHPRAAAEKARLSAAKKWETGNRFDVALLRIERPLKKHLAFLLTSKKLSRPQASQSQLIPPLLQATGFGFEAYDILTDTRVGKAQLQTAKLELRRFSEGVIYINQKDLTGICIGDSGAPLFIPGQEDLLLGIAASVRNQPGESAACTGESRFVYTTLLTDWILSVIKNK